MMPNPKETVMPLSQGQMAMLGRLTGKNQDSDLAGEIAALRAEIVALRAALLPVPSLILTGQQALDEFRRISQGLTP